jgi:hypothetical protein
VPGPRRPELVFHLHRFDDDNGLANVDLVTVGDEHSHHSSGHRGHDRDLAVTVQRRLGVRGSPAVHRHTDSTSAETDEKVALTYARNDLQIGRCRDGGGCDCRNGAGAVCNRGCPHIQQR